MAGTARKDILTSSRHAFWITELPGMSWSTSRKTFWWSSTSTAKLFTKVENIAQLLFGKHISEVLERCLDMRSFFTPLSFLESYRHAVDSYVRNMHPELDLSKPILNTVPKM
jgi:hypothetical protein